MNNKLLIRISGTYKYPFKWSKKFLIHIFAKNITSGKLGLKFHDEVIIIGKGEYLGTITPPTILKLFFLLMQPSLGLCSQYVNGYWNCEDKMLYNVLNSLVGSKKLPFYNLFKLFNKYHYLKKRILANFFPLKAQRSIFEPYTDDPNFMQLILGSSLVYSSGFFDNGDSLDRSQENKNKIIGIRLKINKNDHVLDLGCGFGQTAKWLAQEYESHVTGVCFSDKQINFAKKEKTTLTEFICSDYASLDESKKYEKIYSVGMLEHLGKNQYVQFFSKISRLMKSNGTALIHSTIQEPSNSSRNIWINDSCYTEVGLPKISDITQAIEEVGLKIEKIYTHKKTNYFKTADLWLTNFYKNRDNLRFILVDKLNENNSEKILKQCEFELCANKVIFSKDNGYCKDIQVLLKH